MILNGSNTKKGYLFQIGGESVAIIWSTAARLFLLSCHQPLLRSSGLPCPDFQMLPPQLSTRKRMTKSASLPLIFHLHTWIKQQGPNGLKARMVGRDLHICCVFTYLEISWAKRRGKGDWDQQPDREKPCRTSLRQRFGKSPKFHRKLFQMVHLPTNAHKYRTTEWPEIGKPSQRIKNHAGIWNFLQLTKRKDTQKFQVATGIPSMASERQVYILHQQVLWYRASLRPWKGTKLVHVR